MVVWLKNTDYKKVDELYRIEKQIKIIKDFELIAICDILDIKLENLNDVIKDEADAS